MLEKTPKVPVAFEKLHSDILMLILVLAGDPVYMGRLKQVSKILYHNLTQAQTSSYWERQLKRDFPKFVTHQKNPDFLGLYQKQLAIRRKNSDLPDHIRKLFNYIRSGDLELIKKSNYFVGYRKLVFNYNEFRDIFDATSTNAVSLACQLKRIDILNYIYKRGVTAFHSKKTDIGWQTQLHWAATCGIVSEVKRLSTLCPIDNLDSSGVTALYLAAANGNTSVIRCLLAAGANPNISSDTGHTPFSAAIVRGHYKTVQVLLESGRVDPNQQNNGLPMLFHAIAQQHPVILASLLAAGANVETRPGLEEAVYLGNIEAVKVFLEYGIPVTRAVTAFGLAIQFGQIEICKYWLSTGIDANSVCDEGPFLHVASKYNQLEILTALLKGTPNIDVVYEERTALAVASRNGFSRIVDLLLKAGANVDLASGRWRSPLFGAAENGHAIIIETLLQAGASCKLYSGLSSPLFIAANRGHVAATKILASVIDVNEAMPYKHALSMAAFEGHKDVVNTLLMAGADPYILREDSEFFSDLPKKADMWALILLARIRWRHKTDSLYTQCLAILNANTGQSNVFSFFSRWHERNVIRDFSLLKNQINESNEIEIIKNFLYNAYQNISPEKFTFIIDHIISPAEEHYSASNTLKCLKLT